MKKFLKFTIVATLAIFTSVTFYSCIKTPTNPQSTIQRKDKKSSDIDYKELIKEECEKFNKQCPIEYAGIGEISTIKYDEENNTIHWTMLLDESLVNSIDILEQNKDLFNDTYVLLLANSENRNFSKLITDNNVNVKITYKGSKTGKTIEFNVTPEELQKALESDLSEEDIKKKNLDYQLTVANSAFPIEVEPGIVTKKIVEEKDNIVYIVSVDESMYSMNDLKNNRNYLKSSIQINLTDRAMKPMIELVLSFNKGLQYRYIGNKSKKKVEISFNQEELESAKNLFSGNLPNN